MQRSGHSSSEIRDTGLTSYVGTRKSCLSDQNIPPEKSVALDSQPTLEYAKVVGFILIRNAVGSHIRALTG